MELRRHIRHLFADRCAPAILMFHRVAEAAPDPWGLCVSPSRFEQQMQSVSVDRIPLPMTEFVNLLEAGTLPANAVAVTFDDGYVDNVRVAMPILEKAGVPATIFLTTGYLGQKKEFWWDELARLILGCRESLEGTITIGTRTIAVQIPALSRPPAMSSAWRVHKRPGTPREELYLEIWTQLRLLEHSARERAVECVRQLFGREEPCENDLPMSADDVRILVAKTCVDVEIGAHTETHPPLTALTTDDRRREIQGSRAACEALTGKPVTGFAYPHGDLDEPTASLVRDSGFRWACSTNHAVVDPSRFDLFRLPRIQALNWTGRELTRVLNRAATVA
jgi:peptidoglycan/xylan/chitin deacetylase (PgdA/CDA1 family)